MYFVFAANDLSAVIDTTTGDVCFNSSVYSRYCSQSTTYSVSVFDVTGFLAYTREHISPELCVHTPVYEHSVCAPFNVVVSNHNPQQTSQTQTYTIASGKIYRNLAKECPWVVHILL